MSIRKHAAIVVVSLTLCLAVTLLSSVTAHCAEPQAEQVTLTPKHKSVIPAPRIAVWAEAIAPELKKMLSE